MHTFWDHADFSGATFLGATNFTGTKFEKGAYFKVTLRFEAG